MAITYDQDIIAWANEQAAHLRAGRFDLLDLEHIAEEIEDVGKSEQRELESRIAILLMHLLKWQYQPSHRSKSWERTIKEQRKRILIALKTTPSLKNSLNNQDWLDSTWSAAVSKAIDETNLDVDIFPENCQWSMSDVLTEGWLPA